MELMVSSPHPQEIHKSQRANWLRAAVLGVDDGIVSTSSIMIGVLAAQADSRMILTTGVAALVAGAFSMAAGEYVSVSSQRDAEEADIAIEERALRDNPDAELRELASIYEDRGIEPALALEVAKQLHAHDAVEAHARDELGINSRMRAQPMQAAAASAIAFALGAMLPIVAALLTPGNVALPIVGVSLFALAMSGAAGAVLGGGSRVKAAIRVFIGGGVAMAVTALVGYLLGVSI